MPEEWVTYRRRRSESLSRHQEPIQERYVNIPPEVKEVSHTIEIYRDDLVSHLSIEATIPGF